jgi:hypothetical protein
MLRHLARPCWLVALALVLVAPALADEVVYPPGSRIGLAPPAGLQASKSFLGFEDPDHQVGLLLTAMPPEAYAAFEKLDAGESLKKLGAVMDKREALTLPTGKATLLVSHQDNVHTWMLVAATSTLTAMLTLKVPDTAKDLYSDQVIRSLFASLAVRSEVPVEEQLTLLPFRVADLAGFKVGTVVPGQGILLIDPATPSDANSLTSRIIITALPAAAAEAGNRNDIARQIFRGIPGIAEVHITAAEQIRIGGQQGHEIMATARDPASGADLAVVQWLRFGSGAYLHVVGVAPTPSWTQAYGRFRAVRDGIELR